MHVYGRASSEAALNPADLEVRTQNTEADSDVYFRLISSFRTVGPLVTSPAI